MSTPASNQNEPSKMKRIMSADLDESIRARLPHGNGSPVQNPPTFTDTEPPPAAPSPEPEPKRKRWRFKFLPAFWTVASVISITVNLVLIIALLIMLQMFGAVKGIQLYATDRMTGVLGGLYTNFVKMDQASIKTNIHVEKEIPVQFSLNVSGPTDVTLSRPVTINGALVTVETGGLNIRNARATIVLPEGLVLPINIQNLVVPVDQKVPAVLDVPVNIPLNQTELHEPFVGLQKVVEPWYCLVEPHATVNGLQVCSQAVSPESVNPTPVGTVIP
ncbi:MAG TPA: hypothetical protein VK249_32835 [Anaerolineales bacterium]|nr:hypothetical protein [Anaerolineales bacterium]